MGFKVLLKLLRVKFDIRMIHRGIFVGFSSKIVTIAILYKYVNGWHTMVHQFNRNLEILSTVNISFVRTGRIENF